MKILHVTPNYPTPEFPIFGIFVKEQVESLQKVGVECDVLNCDGQIMGTEFNCKDGKIMGIKQHPFWHEKVDTLVEHGIAEVDEAYFDSKWDECLKPLCKRWYRVKNGKIVETGEEIR